MKSNRCISETIGHLVVISGDYPASGHIMQVFVQQLVNAMIDSGTDIDVIAPQSIVHAIIHREKLLPRISVVTTSSGSNYKVYRPYILSGGNSLRLQRVLRLINEKVLFYQLNKIRPDTIYAHFWSSAQLVYKYALQKKKPLFVACGEGDNALEDMIETIPPKELSKLRDSVYGVVSVSSNNKDKCIRNQLVDSKNINVFPNCVNTALFTRKDSRLLKQKLGISSGDFVIAFVGGFIPRKGPDRLAEAIKRIADPSIKVMFIGRPFKGYQYDFKCPGIVFKGPVSHELLPKYLSCADIFVLPTLNEGCCNAIVEALAIGMPVISSNRPFNDDILDEMNSIRIDPNNIEELVDAINKLKNDENLRESMSAISNSRKEMYSIEGRAKRILHFMNQQINKPRLSRE